MGKHRRSSSPAAAPAAGFAPARGGGIAQTMQRAMAAYQGYQWTEADRLARSVLLIDPADFDALHLCGVIAAQSGRMRDAADLLGRAVAANPRNPDVCNSLGNVLRELGRLEEALALFDRAVAMNPRYAVGWSNRGNVLHDLMRHADALESYQRAIAIEPAYPSAWNNRGMVLQDLGDRDAAVESFQRAVALNPGYADAYANLGTAFTFLDRQVEALECYDRALRLKPDFEFLYGAWLIQRNSICEWQDWDRNVATMLERIGRGDAMTAPFVVHSVATSAAIQRRASQIYVERKFPPRDALGPIAARGAHERIRVGYFSGDLWDHALAHLTAELFERHDRSRFEITAFSFTPDSGTAMRRRLEVAFDRYIDVRSSSDREVAALARELEIDIAVDLTGFTLGARTGIFTYRAAPVQVSYLGFLGTLGAPYIDYLFADATIVPAESRMHYTEKIAYLRSYQVNDTTRMPAERTFTRDELGLPPDGFVFCCFNSAYKITPEVFDSWMRILAAVEGSSLMLLHNNDRAVDNLRKQAERRGVAGGRLAFVKRLPMPEHLARNRAADLFLDTRPYNAGATAADALWAGLPVITMPGETFASRVAASLLTAVGMPELITSTADAYESLAIALARDPQRMAAVRAKLAANRLRTPLFDIAGSVASIEAAYTVMHERARSGLPPEHIGG